MIPPDSKVYAVRITKEDFIRIPSSEFKTHHFRVIADLFAEHDSDYVEVVFTGGKKHAKENPGS